MGMTSQLNAEFVRLLAQRGKVASRILQEAGVAHSHGTQVLQGRRSGCDETRRKIAQQLTQAEIKALGWAQDETTLQELLFRHEDAALQTAMDVVKHYQQLRGSVLRLSALVEEHPEFFGPVTPGQNLLDVASAKLEALLKPAELEKAA